jgi:L-iditol 2-dehydrogenase
MNALVLTGPSQFELQILPTPEPGPGEVRIAVAACGICGSDVHGMDGSTGRRRPPIVMGHEAAGTVAAVGPGVAEWRVGDRVTFDSTLSCGRCEHCRRGEVNLCHHRRVLGVSCEEYRQPGAFAESVVVPAHLLFRLPDTLSFEEAALIEPFAIALHAVRRRSVEPNSSVLIIGCGMIGLALLQTARIVGFGRITMIDTDAGRLRQARDLGADAAHDSSDGRALDTLLAETGGRGFDQVFEAVGVPATVDLAVRAARKGGSVTLVGNVTPTVPLPLQAVVTRELTLSGSCASAGEYPACIDLMARGRISARPLLSAVAPLAEGASWFHRLHAREPGLLKVILRP